MNLSKSFCKLRYLLVLLLSGYAHKEALAITLDIPDVKQEIAINIETDELSDKNVANLDYRTADIEVNLYISSVSAKIERTITTWPKTQDDSKIYGSVRLTILIDSHGNVLKAYRRGTHSKDYSALEMTAISQVMHSSPFAPPSKNLLDGKKYIQFSRTLSYSKPLP